MKGNTLGERSDDEHNMLPWLGRTSKLMYVWITQQLKQYNIPLTPKQWIVLKHLLNEDGMDQKHLASATERDKTSLGRLITSMEKKGLVRRESSPSDKRVNRVFITGKGIEVFNQALPIVHQARESFDRIADEEDMRVTVRTIRKLYDHLKELTTQNGEE